MAGISGVPQHLPMGDDRFSDEDYARVPGEVGEVERREPEALKRVWNKLAADGEISKADAREIDRAMGTRSLFGANPAGLDPVEARFLAIRLGKGGPRIDPEVRKRYEEWLAGRQARMEKGEVLSGTFTTPEGSIHEITEGVIDMPLDRFLKLMPADRWAVNLADYRGGEVKVTERDSAGRVVRQRERMVTETPQSKLLPSLFLPNDMTKVEKITHDANGAVIRWKVLDSENKTTLKDIGTLRFTRMGNKTKVELESEHVIDAFPGLLAKIRGTPLEKPYQAGTAAVMRDYFSKCIRHYQGIAAGKAKPR